MIHLRVHTHFFLKEANRPETCNNGEVEVKFWWVGKWVGLLRKRNAFWKSISGTMNQDLLHSCVIVSKLLSCPKILFLYLKNGYNIGNVYLRVIVKTKWNYICKVLIRLSATMYMFSNWEPFKNLCMWMRLHTHAHIYSNHPHTSIVLHIETYIFLYMHAYIYIHKHSHILIYDRIIGYSMNRKD